MNALHEQIEKARKRIRFLKLVTPEMFPEWQAMKIAQQRFDEALKELEEAKRRWKKLGSKP